MRRYVEIHLDLELDTASGQVQLHGTGSISLGRGDMTTIP